MFLFCLVFAMSLSPFYEKTINVLLKWTLFLLGPIYKLFKSHFNYALRWILRILGPIKFCKGPIKISNGPLKFGNLHVFEWDIGHWPIIIRAHPAISHCSHLLLKM